MQCDCSTEMLATISGGKRRYGTTASIETATQASSHAGELSDQFVSHVGGHHEEEYTISVLQVLLV